MKSPTTSTCSESNWFCSMVPNYKAILNGLHLVYYYVKILKLLTHTECCQIVSTWLWTCQSSTLVNWILHVLFPLRGCVVTVSPTENTSLKKKVTVFALKKWAVRKIDRRSFLWKGQLRQMEAIVRLDGRKQPDQRYLVGLAFVTWRGLVEHCGASAERSSVGDCCTLETNITFTSLFYFPSSFCVWVVTVM